MKLATRNIVKEIERRAIEECKISGLILMENAGRAAASALLTEFPAAGRVAVFAGAGNNGGDGFVIARHLISRGLHVTTYLIGDAHKYSGDALLNLASLRKIGGRVVELHGGFAAYTEADVAVDALFGTGLSRNAAGFERAVIEFINSLACPKIAVDLPSGLDADTGHPLGAAVKADITVTFILPKLGLSIYPGTEYAGRVYLAHLTTPEFLEEGIPYELIDSQKVGGILKPRRADTHKGAYGHLFVIAGSSGKTGAAALTATGAMRSGAGLVTLGAPVGIHPVMEAKLTEAMTEPLPETAGGVLGGISVDYALGILSSRKTALAIGPGISTTPDTREFVYEIIRKCPVPMVIDADAITLIAESPEILREAKAPVALTPHPGEMSRLTGRSADEVQRDRIGVARDFSAMYNAHLVLKGARTIVATPQGEIFINPTGNPAMASGGMGDVLAGVIGGFLAQGYSPKDACVAGVFIHGSAGDMAADSIGRVGITAGDVASAIPAAMGEILAGGRRVFIREIY
ncbi:MAG: NAD(P)H-hydrate dehydratase [Deltaproteobacteria bacterium]